jgi:hypothetical protein
MMTILRRWTRAGLVRAILSKTDRVPLLDQLQSGTRRGMLLGAAAGFVGFFLLGALLGALNRGWGGLVVGAISGALAGGILGGAAGMILGPRYLPQEGNALISIEVDHPSAPFPPGSEVVGSVHITAEDTLKVDSGELFLLCRGIYAHDQLGQDGSEPRFMRQEREYVLQREELLSSGVLRRGQVLRLPFRFALPADALPTYRGLVCSVQWSLYAILRAPDIPLIKSSQDLLVTSTDRTDLPVSEAYQVTSSSQVCQLTLNLPRVSYLEGESLEGRLQIMPLVDFEADEVRAVLLRIETVPQGDDHLFYVTEWDEQGGTLCGERLPGGFGTNYIWLENEAVLTGVAFFKATESVTRPFTLEVPSAWRPTFSTHEGHATWKVGVVVSRLGHSDVRALHEIIVQTKVAVGSPE